MELGTDEAYYWFYSQYIKFNYFDHPPIVAFLIRLFTGNLLLQSHEGFIRLGSVVGCGLSSWFIYKTCTLLYSPRAGLFGVCLYNTSFFAAVTAGIFIMPDSPLMIFYTFCLLTIAKISKDDNNWSSWILFGITSGLSIMSKIYGGLPWIGLGIFILLQQQSWLAKPQLYVALLISAFISIPILLWNLQYHFVTYEFHSQRLSLSKSPVNIISFLREISNQFFFNNPFTVIIIATALIWYIKNKAVRLPALAIYNYIALPFALLLLVVSLKRHTTLPHWSGPAYVALIPIAAIYMASRSDTFPKMLRAGVAGFIIFLLIWQGLIQFYTGTLGEQKPSIKYEVVNKLQKLSGVFDGFTEMQLIAEPLNSWSKAEEQFAIIYKNDISKGIMKPNSPVICYKWWGAQVEYYFCLKEHNQMIGLGNLDELHEYMWANTKRKEKVNMETAYCIVPSDIRYDVRDRYSHYYSFTDSITTIKVARKFRPPLYFYIYRLSGWKKYLPLVK